MFNTLLREIITLSVLSTENSKAAAISTIAVFATELLILLIIFPIGYGLYIYKESPEKPVIHSFSILLQTLGAVSYFYGDNINPIMQRYGEELDCDDSCINNNRIAAVMALGLSLIIFYLFPQVTNKISIMISWENVGTGWYSAIDMIGIILKLDIVFTIVEIMTQTDEFCSTNDVGLSSPFIVICFFAGVFAMIIYGVYSCVKLDNSDKCKCITFAFFLLVFCLPMYLLADNQQPLDCAFGCDTFAANMTENEINCEMYGNSGLRIGFTTLSFLIVIFTPLAFGCCHICHEEVPDELPT